MRWCKLPHFACKIKSMSHIATTSQKLFDLQVHFECGGNIQKYLKAYPDGVGVWTIGIGTVYLPDGTKVKQGDTCTIEQAMEYKNIATNHITQTIDATTPDTLTQGNIDALVDFAYNLGEGAWRGSTLHKLIIADPTDYYHIETAFLVWDKEHKNGALIESPGLLRRRKCEFYLYKNGENHPTFFL